jgi:hypothetical protein
MTRPTTRTHCLTSLMTNMTFEIRLATRTTLTGKLAAGSAEIVEKVVVMLDKVWAWIWVNTTNEK